MELIDVFDPRSEREIGSLLQTEELDRRLSLEPCTKPVTLSKQSQEPRVTRKGVGR